jgi:predicted nucleic acid-binding protein
MRFLIDTNVFREIGKTEPDTNVAAWLDTVDDADLAISALTAREARKGISKPDHVLISIRRNIRWREVIGDLKGKRRP